MHIFTYKRTTAFCDEHEVLSLSNEVDENSWKGLISMPLPTAPNRDETKLRSELLAVELREFGAEFMLS